MPCALERETPPAVEIRNISVSFASSGCQARVLSGLSLSVAPGEFVCILGPNGSGKTTLLSVVAGFIRPTEGEVLIAGEAVRGRGMDRGVVFQEYALFPWRTALENVGFGLETVGVRGEERTRRALAYLALVGLEGFSGAYPHQLSGGMKQRVAVARALAYDPSILLMDEPFAALDAESRESCRHLVLRIWAETGKTILYVTHSLSEAVLLADRVIVLVSPGTVCEKTIALARPRSRRSEGFADVLGELRRCQQRP